MPLLTTRGAGSIRSFGFAGASAPLNLSIPSISGTTTVGNALSSTTGTWSGTPTITFAYQWVRSGNTNVGSNSSTYTLVSADAGATITCTVTATNSVSAVNATSNATDNIGWIPNIYIAPTVSGTATVGAPLSTTNGNWNGYPSPSYTYQWYRSGSAIGGATSSSYTAVNADQGNTITCTVTATNSVGSDSSGSSNSITMPAAPGQVAFTNAGAYSWTAPAGVTSISVLAVGGGGGGGGYNASVAAGGGLGYTNNLSVTPGTTYNIQVGDGGYSGGNWSNGGTGGSSHFNNSYIGAYGGQGAQSVANPSAGGPLGSYNGGGTGGYGLGGTWCGGGGGAAGYSGNGGSSGPNNGSGPPNGGGAAGGSPEQHTSGTSGSGGGVGLLGQGSNGSYNGGYSGGGGGSGGGAGGNDGGPAGLYGGAGGGAWHSGTPGAAGGARGAVRIMWGGGRSYPNNAGNV